MVFIILFFITALGAEAQSNLSLQAYPTTVSGSYVIDQETVSQQSLRVRYRDRTEGQNYFITFSAGQSGDFLARSAVDAFGNAIPYQIYGDAALRNILKDLSASPANSEVLAGYFPPSNGAQNQSRSFAVSIPGNSFPRAGSYTDSVVMTLHEGTILSPGMIPQTASFALSISVPQILDMALVPTGNSFDALSTSLNLNYGVLARSARKTADLMVRGNVPFSVSVLSQNGGRLLSPQILDGSSVPYEFEVNGIPASLSAGVQTPIVSGSGPTSIAGARYGLSFTIGDFGMATEGVYTDTLVFTVAAH
jgi:spore coat protein U-like protein